MAYSIGLDFGTLSVRAVLVRNADGRELATADCGYPHGVITECIPGSEERLPLHFALQDPQDYLDVLPEVIRKVISEARVPIDEITGIGVDATASTIVALDGDMRPLCFEPQYRSNPYSWIRLWKHHGAQKQAEKINGVARERKERFLDQCANQVSAEWYWPKVLEVYENAPDIYEATACFVELGDWIVYLLTGSRKRSASIATVHAQWNQKEGYPSGAYWDAVSKDFSVALEQTETWPVQKGTPCAGSLTEEMARATGLHKGTAVAFAYSDSVVALPSLGVLEEGAAALVIGTSSVMMCLSHEPALAAGAMFNGYGLLDGRLSCHMFGQSAVGDVFNWFAEQMIPYPIYLEARENGVGLIAWMNRKAAEMGPSHLVSLEWLNGCRFFQNMDLRGVVTGLSLNTTAVQLYRSLIEGVAFGLKFMIDETEKKGVRVHKICACGGIAQKSPEIMGILSDIFGKPVVVFNSKQENAHGAAILGAVAAGSARSGYDALGDAVQSMKCSVSSVYEPHETDREAYEAMYAQYKKLATFFNNDAAC